MQFDLIGGRRGRKSTRIVQRWAIKYKDLKKKKKNQKSRNGEMNGTDNELREK